MKRYYELTATIILGIIVFIFWFLYFPEALSYQEQYQLFLVSFDYFIQDISVVGGLSNYISEFLVQFYYYPLLGAMILSVIYILLQRLTWLVIDCKESKWYLISFIPAILLLWHMGDENVLLSYPVSLIIILLAACLVGKKSWFYDIFLIPLLYWLVGPSIWCYVFIRIVKCGWKYIGIFIYTLCVILFSHHFVATQWPLTSLFLGLNYYRVPMQVPLMQIVLIICLPFLLLCSNLLNKRLRGVTIKYNVVLYSLQISIVLIFSFIAINMGYGKGKYTLLRMDMLVRQGDWNEIINLAQQNQVETAFSSNCVNLALAMTGQLPYRMFSFYQSGEDALIMPSVRDCFSNLPTSEAYFQLGMVNSAMRSSFDLQESILNGKKSGRLTKRIVECCIINGKYNIAKKHLELLKSSLFYRKWAKEAETYLYNDSKVDSHPLWGKLRKMRYKNDFLYNYEEIDKMLGLLFINNRDNKLAMDYYMGELLLKIDFAKFQKYVFIISQLEGYSYLPTGYQEALLTIKNKDLQETTYSRYLKRMKLQVKESEQ